MSKSNRYDSKFGNYSFYATDSSSVRGIIEQFNNQTFEIERHYKFDALGLLCVQENKHRANWEVVQVGNHCTKEQCDEILAAIQHFYPEYKKTKTISQNFHIDERVGWTFHRDCERFLLDKGIGGALYECFIVDENRARVVNRETGFCQCYERGTLENSAIINAFKVLFLEQNQMKTEQKQFDETINIKTSDLAYAARVMMHQMKVFEICRNDPNVQRYEQVMNSLISALEKQCITREMIENWEF